MRKRGKDPQFILSNLTTEDQGMYSCRASWDVRGLTHSVMSVAALGRVLGEFLVPPILTSNFIRSTNYVLFSQRF